MPKTKLRVLHLSPTYFAPESVLGGAERYTLGLATAMAEATPTTLVSFGPKAWEEKRGPLRMRVFRAAHHLGGNLINPLDIRFLAEVAKHDVIHCHQMFTVLTEAALVAGALLRKKVYLTDHGGGGRTFLCRLGVHRLAAGVLAVSEYALTRSKVDGVRGQAIYGGIDVERFTPGFGVKSSEENPNRAKMISVGRFLPHKGFHHLISAIGENELILAGNPSDQNYLNYLKQIASKKRVRFVESPSDLEMIELLRSANLAVYPSTRTGPQGESLSGEPELFGQTPLEAMSCGVPVIVSDVGSYPEIVLQNQSEAVFRDSDVTGLKEKIQRLLSDPSGLRMLGVQSRQHVIEHFTWERVVKICLEAYRLPGV